MQFHAIKIVYCSRPVCENRDREGREREEKKHIRNIVGVRKQSIFTCMAFNFSRQLNLISNFCGVRFQRPRNGNKSVLTAVTESQAISLLFYGFRIARSPACIPLLCAKS